MALKVKVAGIQMDPKIWKKEQNLFPEHSRVLAIQGADMIILPTNWPEGTESVPELIIPTRALENQVFYVAVNRAGEENGLKLIIWYNINGLRDYATFLPQEVAGSGSQDAHGWSHNNSIWYDKATHSLTLSGRHQDAIANIDFDSGKLNYIIGDPEGWPEEMVKNTFLHRWGTWKI